MEISLLNYIWFTAPLLIVVVSTLILIKWFLNQETRRRRQEFLMQNSKEMMRYRLQAYERFALLLERINPEALVLREQQQNTTTFDLQSRLLKTIRNEYNHNLAMQIYISNSTLEAIKAAREEVVRLVNTVATQVPPHVPALELGRRVIEQAGGAAHQKLKTAMNAMSKDIEEMGGRD